MNVCVVRQSVRAHGLFPSFSPPLSSLPFPPCSPGTPTSSIPLSIPRVALFPCLFSLLVYYPTLLLFLPIGLSPSLLCASCSLVDNHRIFFSLFPLCFSFVLPPLLPCPSPPPIMYTARIIQGERVRCIRETTAYSGVSLILRFPLGLTMYSQLIEFVESTCALLGPRCRPCPIFLRNGRVVGVTFDISSA